MSPHHSPRRHSPSSRLRRWTRLASCLVVLAGLACHASPATDTVVSGAGEPEIELAVVMGELQRHGAKLGYSIERSNQPLASFYLHELEESLGELAVVESYEGRPIAHPASVIMHPLVGALENDLELADWEAAAESYAALIEGCNRCHQATEHGFIEILPASGEPPFNQRF